LITHDPDLPGKFKKDETIWKGSNNIAFLFYNIWAGFLLVLLTGTTACADDSWFVSLYGGQFSNTALNEIVRFGTDFENSYIYVLSLGKELGRYKELVSVEMEGQVGQHVGLQSHTETNAAFTLRWLKFPWDRYLDTSLAFGNGLSYAFEDPPLEIREGNEGRTSKWLYYILAEMAFKVPRTQGWEFFLRAHHRSSVFGAIDGLFTASNFVGAGLRYRF
jgi:hypothetical protein